MAMLVAFHRRYKRDSFGPIIVPKDKLWGDKPKYPCKTLKLGVSVKECLKQSYAHSVFLKCVLPRSSPREQGNTIQVSAIRSPPGEQGNTIRVSAIRSPPGEQGNTIRVSAIRSPPGEQGNAVQVSAIRSPPGE